MPTDNDRSRRLADGLADVLAMLGDLDDAEPDMPATEEEPT